VTTLPTTLETIRVDHDADGIVTLVLDDPAQAVNTMRAQFTDDLVQVVAGLRAGREQVAGVVITSAKDTFFAGGDLNELIAAGPDDAEEVASSTARLGAALRELETFGFPVVAVVNGTALGGGLGSRWHVTGASPWPTARPSSACRRSRSGCCPAAAAWSVRCGCSGSPTP
jgi:3-hydroxyacyl-CoA dehydrogenase/enoyl-CoA hydratase/3-hydroxybutyryl-CoA epimerase